MNITKGLHQMGRGQQCIAVAQYHTALLNQIVSTLQDTIVKISQSTIPEVTTDDADPIWYGKPDIETATEVLDMAQTINARAREMKKRTERQTKEFERKQ